MRALLLVPIVMLAACERKPQAPAPTVQKGIDEAVADARAANAAAARPLPKPTEDA